MAQSRHICRKTPGDTTPGDFYRWYFSTYATYYPCARTITFFRHVKQNFAAWKWLPRNYTLWLADSDTSAVPRLHHRWRYNIPSADSRRSLSPKPPWRPRAWKNGADAAWNCCFPALFGRSRKPPEPDTLWNHIIRFLRQSLLCCIFRQ